MRGCARTRQGRHDERLRPRRMTKYCNDCHTANRDRARYCCSCKGRFSGVRFGAHTSASTFPDSLSTPRAAPRAPRTAQGRSRSTASRAKLLLVFLLLLLGPLTYQESTRIPAHWPLVRDSVAAAWQRTWTSLAAPATASGEADEVVPPPVALAPDPAERPSPPHAAPAAITAPVALPVNEPAAAAAAECVEARAALSLCR